MAVKIPKRHNVNYFTSRTILNPETRGGQTKIQTSAICLPEAIKDSLRSIREDIVTLIKSGTDTSCPSVMRSQSSPVVTFTDSDVAEVAQNTEFLHIIDFYELESPDPVRDVCSKLSKHQESWYTISATAPDGGPLINNFTLQGPDLSALVYIINQYTPSPVQEILAFRSATLYQSLILSSSKPF